MKNISKTKNNPKGRLLRVKHGYNPNSSSMGSLVFAIPAAILGVTAGFGVVSGIIMSIFLRDKNKPQQNSGEISEPEKTSSKEGK